MMTTKYDLGQLGHQTLLSSLLILIGLICTTSILLTLAQFVLSTFVLPGVPVSTFQTGKKTKKPSWAVITGASDGIGKEFAYQLSAKGFSVLLVSRTQGKLDALKTDIEKRTGGKAQAETLAIDFSRPTETDYVHLTNAMEGKLVGVLVNNVGLSHEMPVRFEDCEVGELEDIVKINCLATLRVTSCVLPFMLPQRCGLILTMGSFAGLTPTPLLSVYSGSKAFLQAWNTALASELAEKGIMCHLFQSYLVTSAMSKVRRSNWLVPSEKSFVKSALAKIGARGGSFGFGNYTGTPYWSHALMAAGITAVLGACSSVVVSVNKKMHVDVRRRALKKMERDAKKL